MSNFAWPLALLGFFVAGVLAGAACTLDYHYREIHRLADAHMESRRWWIEQYENKGKEAVKAVNCIAYGDPRKGEPIEIAPRVATPPDSR